MRIKIGKMSDCHHESDCHLFHKVSTSIFGDCHLFHIFAFFAFVVNFFLLSYSLSAQQNQPYLVPKQIYVGDLATLVVPLPPAAQNYPDIILTKREIISNETIFYSYESQKPSNTSRETLNESHGDSNESRKISNGNRRTSNESPRLSAGNLEINKIKYERRTTGSGLLIEFAAFAPGEIELPLIKIGSEFFSGYTVKVNSLLENEAASPSGNPRLLSGAASVLAMPGTALMLYGSLAAIIAIILLAIWFIFKGRVVLKNLREKWKRLRLYAGLFNTERRLTKALAKGVDKRIILDKLSLEFREFLSILTGKNCRSMTAREFAREFACEFTAAPEFAHAPQPNQVDEGTFLGIFFGSCDKLRFSGTDIDSNNITKLLDELKIFLEAKQKEEKVK